MAVEKEKMVMGAERIVPRGKNSNIIIALLARFPISDAFLNQMKNPFKRFQIQDKLTFLKIIWNRYCLELPGEWADLFNKCGMNQANR